VPDAQAAMIEVAFEPGLRFQPELIDQKDLN
jgi:hypothetical protein